MRLLLEFTGAKVKKAGEKNIHPHLPRAGARAL